MSRRMELPEILWHRARMRYVGLLIWLAGMFRRGEILLSRQALRIGTDISARLEAAERLLRPET
jgi:hypothetical protein